MGPDHFTILMDQVITANGYMIKGMAKELIFIEIRINMKEIGKKTWNMETEHMSTGKRGLVTYR